MRTIAIDLAIMTVIGLVLALIGPFDTSALPLPRRILTWLAYAYIGYVFYRPVWPLADRLARQLHLPRLGLLVTGCILATIPAASAIWIVETWPVGLRMPTLEQGFSAYVNVLIIGASIMVIFYLIQREQPTATAPAPLPQAADNAPRARLFERLPPHLGGEIIALEMEDHYVRAHTALGSDLILMRLTDAISELDGIAGAQVHRSWWVARGAVEEVRREGRNLRLVLPRGITAPVARANVHRLKEEGWF